MNNLLAFESGARLDVALAQGCRISRDTAKLWIAQSLVLVNEQPAKPSHRLQATDEVKIFTSPPTETPASLVAPLLDQVTLLYEDADLLVLNKPAGLVVHPSQGYTNLTLVDFLVRYCPAIQSIGVSFRPGIMHRLDKDTEGLMVVAKTPLAYDVLSAAFKNREVDKHYYAMVKGDIPDDERILSFPIGRRTGSRKMEILPEAHPDAKLATTYIRVLRRFSSKTLLDVHPITGRTHQIRVHCAQIGHPLIGDPVYFKDKFREGGHLLQAYELAFQHPVIPERLRFRLPLSSRLMK